MFVPHTCVNKACTDRRFWGAQSKLACALEQHVCDRSATSSRARAILPPPRILTCTLLIVHTKNTSIGILVLRRNPLSMSNQRGGYKPTRLRKHEMTKGGQVAKKKTMRHALS